VGAAIILTCAYSFGTIEMRHEKDKYIGYLETGSGIGDTLGPALGGLVYATVGYKGTFLLFGSFIYFGIMCSLVMIPNSLN
jgi:MFS family permease